MILKYKIVGDSQGEARQSLVSGKPFLQFDEDGRTPY